MTKTLWRWYYAARNFRNYGTSLNRRAEVESVLLNIANGKRPLLTPDECRALASKLAGGK